MVISFDNRGTGKKNLLRSLANNSGGTDLRLLPRMFSFFKRVSISIQENKTETWATFLKISKNTSGNIHLFWGEVSVSNVAILDGINGPGEKFGVQGREIIITEVKVGQVGQPETKNDVELDWLIHLRTCRCLSPFSMSVLWRELCVTLSSWTSLSSWNASTEMEVCPEHKVFCRPGGKMNH